jgi:hypothetical protein
MPLEGTMTNLIDIIRTEYDVNPISAPAYAVLWACSAIPDAADAKAQLSKLNRARERAGKPLVYAPYGHHAF